MIVTRIFLARMSCNIPFTNSYQHIISFSIDTFLENSSNAKFPMSRSFNHTSKKQELRAASSRKSSKPDLAAEFLVMARTTFSKYQPTIQKCKNTKVHKYKIHVHDGKRGLVISSAEFLVAKISFCSYIIKVHRVGKLFSY